LPGAPPRPAAASAPQQAAPQANDRWKDYVAAGSKVAAGLDAVAGADPSFSIQTFLDGAKAAYQMIITAFAAGDRQMLQQLLDQDVYESFIAAIAARESRGETMQTHSVAIDDVSIEEAGLRGNKTAQITLRFSSHLISATENAAGEIIEGHAERPIETIDIWTFARDCLSRDPNWKLVATQTGH